MKHTKEELKALQELPLSRKILVSQARIFEFYKKLEGKVCVSYSGGKDSTVLLHMVRTCYPEVPAVYVDTRLDFPEVREHIKATPNVIWLKPEKNFREVINEYGWCYPSKDVATYIASYRLHPEGFAKYLFEGKRMDGTEKPFYEKYKRWKWLLDVNVKISPKCCYYMKEKPLKKFQKESGLSPFVGTLAVESLRRAVAWYTTGCNSFEKGKEQSKPLSFWTEQDILRYLVDNDLKISKVYGSIIGDKHGRLKTTGESRTGCVFCPVGCHLEKINKFEKLQESHPALYKYCMKELKLDEFLTAVHVRH